jgi:hypothetical protein
MNCKKCLSLILPYIDNQLEQDWKQEVEQHLKQCKNCAVELEQLQKVHKLVTQIPVQPVPKELIDETYRKIRSVKQESMFMYRLKEFFKLPNLAVLVPVCVVLLVFGTKYLGNRVSQQATNSVVNMSDNTSQSNPQPANVQPATNHPEINIPLSDFLQQENILKKVYKDLTKLKGRIILDYKTSTEKSEPEISGLMEKELVEKLKELKIQSIDLNDDIIKILKSRNQRFAEIKKMKSGGFIGETDAGLIAAVNNKPLTKEFKDVVKQENEDRKRLLELFTDLFIKKNHIPYGFRSKVLIKGTEMFVEALKEASERDEYIQTNGSWEKKKF